MNGDQNKTYAQIAEDTLTVYVRSRSREESKSVFDDAVGIITSRLQEYSKKLSKSSLIPIENDQVGDPAKHFKNWEIGFFNRPSVLATLRTRACGIFGPSGTNNVTAEQIRTLMLRMILVNTKAMVGQTIITQKNKKSLWRIRFPASATFDAGVPQFGTCHFLPFWH